MKTTSLISNLIQVLSFFFVTVPFIKKISIQPKKDMLHFIHNSYFFMIIIQLIVGPIKNLMNSQALTRPAGSYFQAVQFSGVLRCSLYGNVSQITLYKTESADILVRSHNGSRILDYKNTFCCMSLFYLITILHEKISFNRHVYSLSEFWVFITS